MAVNRYQISNMFDGNEAFTIGAGDAIFHMFWVEELAPGQKLKIKGSRFALLDSNLRFFVTSSNAYVSATSSGEEDLNITLHNNNTASTVSVFVATGYVNVGNVDATVVFDDGYWADLQVK